MHAAIAFAVIASGLEIDSSSECPSSAQVAEQLLAVSDSGGGPGESGVVRERVKLERTGELLVVQLLAPNGIVLAERKLPGSDCADLARTAAVLIAAWR